MHRADNLTIPVYRLAMGWTVRGSNPGGGEILHKISDQSWGPPSHIYNRYPGIKRPGLGFDYPLHLMPRLKKE
jgi:hypothetical protein